MGVTGCAKGPSKAQGLQETVHSVAGARFAVFASLFHTRNLTRDVSTKLFRPAWVSVAKLCGQLVRRAEVPKRGAMAGVPIVVQLPQAAPEWGNKNIHEHQRVRY